MGILELKMIQSFRDGCDPMGPHSEEGKLLVREALSQDGVVLELVDRENGVAMTSVIEPDQAKELFAQLGLIIEAGQSRWFTK